MGPSSSVVYKRLTSLVSSKRNDCYSKTLLFIRCKVGFALLRPAVQCLRGFRSTFNKPHHLNDSDNSSNCVDLAVAEGRVTY